MPQKYCATRSVDRPFVLVAGGTAVGRAHLAAASLLLLWQDGGTDTYTGGTAGAAIASAYGGGYTIDTTATVWLIVAVRGTGLRYVKEQDQATMDATLGGTPQWAILALIDGPLLVYPLPQS